MLSGNLEDIKKTVSRDENYNVWDEKHTWMVLIADEEMQKKRLRNLKTQQ